MKLSYVSISKYRSITTAHKIDLSNLTVLLGQNNEGKTYVLKAIDLGMEILRSMELLQKRKRSIKQLYDWQEDFPLSLQTSKKLHNKNTEVRMDFSMNEDETIELNNIIRSNINGALSIYIKIGESNSLSVTIPKRGKNAKALSDKIIPISRFICNKFDVQFIPAVRSETDAYSVISELINLELSSIEDQVYKDSLEYIEKIQQEKLVLLAKRVKTPLVQFLPQIKSVNLYLTDRMRKGNSISGKIVNMDIDDGVLTSLSNKGDGVKSLSTIAIRFNILGGRINVY
ncbi:AAA family ATPase [Mobilitalea sibirica]|uniref:AAA family ATPase n=1 Tax=Mobilitalea sibirica TaxID=1462919 RepID=A0A8J7H2N2_9FIRM|nr:AAA family ATPase [Mobilitalea sibirica]MBH1941057.1 AAA family ATPase [Mobilitalea sibirica]